MLVLSAIRYRCCGRIGCLYTTDILLPSLLVLQTPPATLRLLVAALPYIQLPILRRTAPVDFFCGCEISLRKRGYAWRGERVEGVCRTEFREAFLE
jgi:hypothetical protein